MLLLRANGNPYTACRSPNIELQLLGKPAIWFAAVPASMFAPLRGHRSPAFDFAESNAPLAHVVRR
jgi:hypothetical protein